MHAARAAPRRRITALRERVSLGIHISTVIWRMHSVYGDGSVGCGVGVGVVRLGFYTYSQGIWYRCDASWSALPCTPRTSNHSSPFRHPLVLGCVCIKAARANLRRPPQIRRHVIRSRCRQGCCCVSRRASHACRHATCHCYAPCDRCCCTSWISAVHARLDSVCWKYLSTRAPCGAATDRTSSVARTISCFCCPVLMCI